MAETFVDSSSSGKNGWILWCIKGRLDRITAPTASENADKVYASAQKLAVDMTALEYLSSAGIRVLLRLTKQAKSDGKEFALVGPTGMVQVVLAESRMDLFATIYESAEELP